MRNLTVLIVEDDEEQLKQYSIMLKSYCREVYVSQDIEYALAVLDSRSVDILFTDIHLTKSIDKNTYEGFDILKYAVINNPECLPVVMSNDPKVSTYRKAEQLGALNFIKKPIISIDEFILSYKAALKNRKDLIVKNDLKAYNLSDELLLKCKDGLVLSESERIIVKKLAVKNNIHCIIVGETGTGKEEIAKLLYKKRVEIEGDIPFVVVNCARLNSSTAISEMFGHVKGAFTGAEDTTVGFIGKANGGLLFLDEVHRLSIECQEILLRVLNDGNYTRVGDTKIMHSKFQIVVASGKNLDTLVAQGQFLPDLKARITGVTIKLKPLRKRLKDIDILVPLFLSRLKANITEAETKKLIERCKTFYWQHNIRQLFFALNTFVSISGFNDEPLLAENLHISADMLPPQDEEEMNIAITKADDCDEDKKQLITFIDEMDICENLNLKESLDLFEKVVMKEAIKRSKTINDAIKLLNLARTTFFVKREKHKLS